MGFDSPNVLLLLETSIAPRQEASKLRWREVCISWASIHQTSSYFSKLRLLLAKRLGSCGGSLLFLGLHKSPARVIGAGGFAKTKFRFANPRNFLDVNVQKHCGFAKTVYGFAKTNDAGLRVVQARNIDLRAFTRFFRTVPRAPTSVQQCHRETINTTEYTRSWESQSVCVLGPS